MVQPTEHPAHGNATTSSASVPLGIHALIDRAAVILRLAADGGDPHGVTRDQFNAARGLVEEDVPTAQAICKRLKRSWQQVVELALGPVGQRMGQGVKRSSGPVDRECPDSLLLTALRACAFAEGGVPSARSYDAWADAVDAKRRRSGFAPNPLPHSATILDWLGEWSDALVAAGVIESKKDLPKRVKPRKTRPIVELIDEFMDEVGILPSEAYFEAWCARMDIPVGVDIRPWKAALAATHERRTRAGKVTPTVLTPKNLAPPLPPQKPQVRRQGKMVTQWTEEKILDALRYYARKYLRDGQQPTQKHYGACASGDDALPSASTLTRHGKPFQDWCKAAGL